MQEGISFQLENNQIKGFLIIVLLELNDLLKGLDPIDAFFQFEVTIKL